MHLSFLICWNKVSTFLFHCTSQACERQRGKDGANALEESGKVNQAICPGSPLFSSIFVVKVQRWKTITLWLVCKSSLSFNNMSSYIVKEREDSECDWCLKRKPLSCFWKCPTTADQSQGLWSTFCTLLSNKFNITRTLSLTEWSCCFLYLCISYWFAKASDTTTYSFSVVPRRGVYYSEHVAAATEKRNCCNHLYDREAASEILSQDWRFAACFTVVPSCHHVHLPQWVTLRTYRWSVLVIQVFITVVKKKRRY